MDAIQAAWAEGKDAWVGVALPLEVFARFIRARAETEAELAALAAKDCYLAAALEARDAGALARFEVDLVPGLERVLSARGASADLRDEALQRMRQKLFTGEAPKIAQYSGKGALGAWLRVVAMRELLQLQRAAPREQGVEDERLLDRASASADPELEHLKTRYRAQFRAAFSESMMGLDPAERNLLRYHYLDGLTMERIGELSGVHQTTITRRLARAREKLLEGTVRRMRDQLSVDANEMESIVRMIQSQLDVSLGGLLRPHDR